MEKSEFVVATTMAQWSAVGLYTMNGRIMCIRAMALLRTYYHILVELIRRRKKRRAESPIDLVDGCMTSRPGVSGRYIFQVIYFASLFQKKRQVVSILYSNFHMHAYVLPALWFSIII